MVDDCDYEQTIKEAQPKITRVATLDDLNSREASNYMNITLRRITDPIIYAREHMEDTKSFLPALNLLSIYKVILRNLLIENEIPYDMYLANGHGVSCIIEHVAKASSMPSFELTRLVGIHVCDFPQTYQSSTLLELSSSRSAQYDELVNRYYSIRLADFERFCTYLKTFEAQLVELIEHMQSEDELVATNALINMSLDTRLADEVVYGHGT